MKKQELITYVEGLCTDLCKQFDYELVDVDYVKEGPNWYLKVACDKEGGFSINDCVTMTHALSDEIDKRDPIEDPYILEVSSPGLDRPLKKDKDFVRSIGKLVDVRLYKPLENIGKAFTAKLVGFDQENQTADFELEDGSTLTLSRKDLSGICLTVIF